MTTPKFTPGPWIIDDSGFQTGMVKGRNGQSNTIAQMYGLVDSEGGEEAAEANATLIASAPDLYAALERLLANAIAKERLINLMEWQHLRVPEPDEVDFSPEMKAARAALAKARGLKGGE